MSETIEVTKLARLATSLKTIREELNKLKEQKEGLLGEEEQVEGEIKAALEAEGLQQAKIVGIGTVFLQSTVNARVDKENREKLFAWLDENGHGDLAQRNIHAQTFAAFYREAEENDQPLPPPEIVKVYRETRAVLRAAK